MNYEKMSEKLQMILMRSVEISRGYSHSTVDTIHLLQAIFEDDVLNGLYQRLSLDKQKALSMIQNEMAHIAVSSGANPQLSNEAAQSFAKAEQWSESVQETYLIVASVWIALMCNKSYISKQ